MEPIAALKAAKDRVPLRFDCRYDQYAPRLSRQSGIAQHSPRLSRQSGIAQHSPRLSRQSGIDQYAPWLSRQSGIAQHAPRLSRQSRFGYHSPLLSSFACGWIIACSQSAASFENVYFLRYPLLFEKGSRQ
ncbi:hypothetical protein [Paenibacillus wynnii]|uniref:hypothetical protein n=1 Tax=Paenibacillus wynnii TaxID=268407 RepID=UPI0027919ED7|nr:hypothetical protein [Paenibacillus wynnii]MDQ0192356.1 hypothetical protein [Paenibacillus wynnii]